MDLKEILPSTLLEHLERVGISTPKQIITLSVWDIKKRTNLCTEDIVKLKDRIAKYLCPTIVTGDLISITDNITSGCVEIDKMLKGGYRVGTITEIYGESGSGKTQLTLHAAAHNWSSGTVFICTEDMFPVKRFEQIKLSIPEYSASKDYGKNIFVEHITEASDLLSCVRVRLPKLLEKNKPSHIVIDSIAAPFRSEYTNYVQRAEELRELAICLINMAQKHTLAVLCINQVTAAFHGPNNVLPTLGLAWSNMISTRLWLRKTSQTMNIRNIPGTATKVLCNEQSAVIRELSVIFAPDLPNSTVQFIITPSGIQST